MKAAILEEIGKPLAIRELNLASHGKDDRLLDQGQVMVKMISSGICGAQLDEIDGKKGDASYCPHLLGHEGCGIVMHCGLGVNISNGRKVIVHWRKGEGHDSELPRFGEIKAGPCTTFSEYTVISENRVTPIPDDVPNDLAALFGCCLSTALATMENVARIQHGDSVLVIGCGGLGLATIIAAKAFGATFVVASDKWENKAPLALSCGADFFMPNWWQGEFARTLRNPSSVGNHQLPSLDREYLYDVIIDTPGVGSYDYLLKPNERYIVMNGEKKNSEGGGFNPTKDIPRYVQMWREGKLKNWEKIITHRIKLEQINEGIELMRKGLAGRVIIDFT